jgi:hypothetical protein
MAGAPARPYGTNALPEPGPVPPVDLAMSGVRATGPVSRAERGLKSWRVLAGAAKKENRPRVPSFSVSPNQRHRHDRHHAKDVAGCLAAAEAVRSPDKLNCRDRRIFHAGLRRFDAAAMVPLNAGSQPNRKRRCYQRRSGAPTRGAGPLRLALAGATRSGSAGVGSQARGPLAKLCRIQVESTATTIKF